ncbi:MAG: DUF4054 domain-containing protein [Aeromonas veronii]|uniref:DUF4054 domain-containing protein n=1 Tax=Aeromonas veronii TaxID=654 RepID=UPI00244324C7|nr:DUF4054 domain-containing protein [Aeromonas veronii]
METNHINIEAPLMYQNFRKHFPQFSDAETYPDALIEVARQMALPDVAGKSWTDERRQRGLSLLVAHYLACDLKLGPAPFEQSRYGQEFKRIRPKHVALAL